jgi:uncharacterized membrane protein
VTPAAPTSRRKGYLDWLRGVGVIVMIQGHVIDSWTLRSDRGSTADNWITFVGGIAGAPVFLVLAGVALTLAAGSRARDGLGDRAAAALARRRGWQIFGLAFLFRLQSWLISGGPLQTLLKVDILNVMGVAMIVTGALWGMVREVRARAGIFAGSAVACAMLTPVLRTAGIVGLLPDPVEWYVRPAAGMATFSLFPWAAFVLAGAACGIAFDAARTVSRERLVNLGLAIAGLSIAAAGYAASFLPAIYAQTNFWTSSPTFFFVRLGIVMALVPMAYLVDGRAQRSPLRDFGRASLFVYWIHVEMAYGVLSAPLHKRLPLEWAYLAFVLFTLLLFGLVRVKNRFAAGLWPQAPGLRAGQGVRTDTALSPEA